MTEPAAPPLDWRAWNPTWATTPAVDLALSIARSQADRSELAAMCAEALTDLTQQLTDERYSRRVEGDARDQSHAWQIATIDELRRDLLHERAESARLRKLLE